MHKKIDNKILPNKIDAIRHHIESSSKGANKKFRVMYTLIVESKWKQDKLDISSRLNYIKRPINSIVDRRCRTEYNVSSKTQSPF